MDIPIGKLSTLGDTSSENYIPRPSAWYKNNRGYIVRSVPQSRSRNQKKTQSQHRLIMEEHLGRKLLPGENVHHINGVKDDNRIENLELWSTVQPKGQRVQDKLDWAYEIIALYGKGD